MKGRLGWHRDGALEIKEELGDSESARDLKLAVYAAYFRRELAEPELERLTNEIKPRPVPPPPSSDKNDPDL